MRFFAFLLTLVIIISLQSCSINKEQTMIKKEVFGHLSDGREVYLYTMHNSNGMQMKVTNYGATITLLTAPDRNGKLQDVVLGYDSLAEYVKGDSYFGAVVGRYGNRIGEGKFTLEGQQYQLTINNGPNHLHGGTTGYNKVLWEAKENNDNNSITFSYNSQDGEQGYPGNVTLSVTYSLTENNELKIDYKGTTDKTTILNPTHHSYFNLTGDPEKTILDHQLTIIADKFTPVDSNLITTGELAEVSNTPFDFREPTAIGKRINEDNIQLKYGNGYDHNWVLSNYNGKVEPAVVLYEPQSGRMIEVLTDQPGMQFYSGNFLDGTVKGKNGIYYKFRTGLCLEAQHYPDSPNKSEFPSVTLKPGEEYKQTTIYRFSAK